MTGVPFVGLVTDRDSAVLKQLPECKTVGGWIAKLNEVNSTRDVGQPISDCENFRIKAESRLKWFERELALLSPTSPDYEKNALSKAHLGNSAN